MSNVGALDGGSPCRLSILRNANVACLCRLWLNRLKIYLLMMKNRKIWIPNVKIFTIFVFKLFRRICRISLENLFSEHFYCKTHEYVARGTVSCLMNHFTHIRVMKLNK